MPAWLIWIAGVLVVTAETALLGAAHLGVWSLQTPIAITVLLASYRPFTSGALTLAALMIPMASLVGSPPGHYGFGLTIVFLGLHGLQRRIRGDRGVLDLLAAGIAALVHPLIVSLVLALIGPDSARPTWWSWSVPLGAVAAPLVVWPLRAGLRRADEAFESSMTLTTH